MFSRHADPARAPLSLALQGGGAHGAFTWGVLDALLKHDTHPIRAVSGTSAGAVNAVALAYGLLEGGREGARASLARVWQAIGSQPLPFALLTRGEGEDLRLAPAARTLMQWSRHWTPAQLNPLGLNPLREVLSAHVDFERLRRDSGLPVFLAATHVNSGRLRLFGTRELSVETVLASACLPTLHHTVVVDGEPYWDGGYSANPALFPLADEGRPDDVLIVLLNRLQHPATPQTAEEIEDRIAEIAFNANFLREALMIGEAQALARRRWRWAASPLERRLRSLRFHLIAADESLSKLRRETKLIAHGPFLQHLHDLGHAQTLQWLQEEGGDIGRRSGVDLLRRFSDPTASAFGHSAGSDKPGA